MLPTVVLAFRAANAGHSAWLLKPRTTICNAPLFSLIYNCHYNEQIIRLI